MALVVQRPGPYPVHSVKGPSGVVGLDMYSIVFAECGSVCAACRYARSCSFMGMMRGRTVYFRF